MMDAEVRAEIRGIVQEIGDRYWEIAALLCQIFDNGWYKSWGYGGFGEYVLAELDFQVRSAQYMRRAWVWHLTLPSEGQEWARKTSIHVLRRFISEITAENWAEWRDKLVGITTAKADVMRRDLIRERIGRGRDIRVRRVVKETEGMPLVERMCAMRTSEMSVEEVADNLGVKTADVRSSLRLIQIFVPLEVYECIRAHDGVRHVESELLQVVMEWYKTPELGTGTDGK
jgi:hypothetical protein